MRKKRGRERERVRKKRLAKKKLELRKQQYLINAEDVLRYLPKYLTHKLYALHSSQKYFLFCSLMAKTRRTFPIVAHDARCGGSFLSAYGCPRFLPVGSEA